MARSLRLAQARSSAHAEVQVATPPLLKNVVVITAVFGINVVEHAVHTIELENKEDRTWNKG